MTTELLLPGEDTRELESLAVRAFSDGEDSDISEWFSFNEMASSINASRGACIKAVSEDGVVRGFIYAQQENPINGREGIDKWVIVIAAVPTEYSGKGVGANLLTSIEKCAKDKGASKMFVYTNKNDEQVINFYKKNGYEDAGWVRDYQYGKDNSAVFLLKYLK